VFVMTGTETISCPKCHGELELRDRRRRSVIDAEGRQHVCSVRRLRCKRCGRLHTELPDFIVPYKRYSAAVIVSVSEGEGINVPYEERTRQKIRAWCERVISHLQGVWRQQVNLGFVSPYIVPNFVSLVRATVNSGNWLCHPFGRTAYAF
jgi:uncharacterized protein YbaR (Trm112 family)